MFPYQKKNWREREEKRYYKNIKLFTKLLIKKQKKVQLQQK